jgi:hypothetical protein
VNPRLTSLAVIASNNSTFLSQTGLSIRPRLALVSLERENHVAVIDWLAAA